MLKFILTIIGTNHKIRLQEKPVIIMNSYNISLHNHFHHIHVQFCSAFCYNNFLILPSGNWTKSSIVPDNGAADIMLAI